MKKLIIAAIALLAVGAGAYYWMTRPAQVVVQAVLTEGGQDVTDQVSWDVFRVLEEVSGDGITFTTVEGVIADPDELTKFTVPAGQEIVVEAAISGMEDLSQMITVSRGATESVVFNLNAGLVSIDVVAGDGDDSDFRLSMNDGTTFYSYGLPGPDATTFAVPAGTYNLSLMDAKASGVQVITVEAGSTQDVSFDERVAQLSVALGDQGWSEDLPEIYAYLTLANGTEVGPRLFHENGEATFTDVPFGTHLVKAMSQGGGSIAFYPVEEELTVDATDTTATLPFDHIRVDVDLSAFEDTSDLSVFAIEATSKGERYSSANADGGDAVALYLAPTEDGYDAYDFGVAVRNRDGFLAVVNFGKPEMGSTVQATPQPGEGKELCDYLYGASSCEQM